MATKKKPAKKKVIKKKVVKKSAKKKAIKKSAKRKITPKQQAASRENGALNADEGRPTAYLEDYETQAYSLCLLGATDAELGEAFGVSEQTINAWKQKHPGFLESMTRGKMIADAKVAHSLFQRAVGYEHESVHVSNFQGDVTLTPITKHYPPDTPAASLWLRNRQKDKWRDKQEFEHTGPDGGSIKTETNLTITPDEAYRLLIHGGS